MEKSEIMQKINLKPKYVKTTQEHNNSEKAYKCILKSRIKPNRNYTKTHKMAKSEKYECLTKMGQWLVYIY